MVEGRVEVDDGRLVPTVRRACASERRADFVDECSIGPQFTRHVEKLLELRRGQAVAGRRAEDDGVRPFEIGV